MARQVHRFDRPERFVVGTVGEPGDRVFYLQAREGTRVVSVLVEKEQARALAESIVETLDEVRSTIEPDLPREPPPGQPDVDPLDTPVEPEFRVGALSLTWEGRTGSVVVEARAVGVEETGAKETGASEFGSADAGAEETGAAEALADPAGPADGTGADLDALVVSIGPAEALAFAARAQQVVAAGRRPCPLCGMPLSPQGHVCPRDNGYRRGSPT